MLSMYTCVYASPKLFLIHVQMIFVGLELIKNFLSIQSSINLSINHPICAVINYTISSHEIERFAWFRLQLTIIPSQ